jgi:Flp pilus assembly pilin Flp
MLTVAVQLLRATLQNRSGVSSIEYGVLAIGIIAAISAAMVAFKTDIVAAFGELGSAITAAFTPSSGG